MPLRNKDKAVEMHCNIKNYLEERVRIMYNMK